MDTRKRPRRTGTVRELRFRNAYGRVNIHTKTDGRHRDGIVKPCNIFNLHTVLGRGKCVRRQNNNKTHEDGKHNIRLRTW